ncbi:unnamed protein product, partial [Meganyctiphanes norvegica]
VKMGDTLFGKGRSEDKRRLEDLRKRVEAKRAEDKKKEEEAKEAAKVRRHLAKKQLKEHGGNAKDLDSPVSTAATDEPPHSPRKILNSSSPEREKDPNSPMKENNGKDSASLEKEAPKAEDEETSLAPPSSVVGDSWTERLFGMCMCCEPASASPVQTVVPAQNQQETS